MDRWYVQREKLKSGSETIQGVVLSSLGAIEATDWTRESDTLLCLLEVKPTNGDRSPINSRFKMLLSYRSLVREILEARVQIDYSILWANRSHLPVMPCKFSVNWRSCKPSAVPHPDHQTFHAHGTASAAAVADTHTHTHTIYYARRRSRKGS